MRRSNAARVDDAMCDGISLPTSPASTLTPSAVTTSDVTPI
jgi:hypothetical protein